MEASKNAGDVLKQLTATLSRAANDLSRADKARKRKADTEKVAQAKKAAKKQEQEKKRLEDSLKKAHKDDQSLIFFQDLPIFNDIPVLEEGTFAQDIAKVGEGPYLVKALSLSSIVEGNSQNILSVFAAQFPMAPQAREKGRVQSQLKVTDAQLQKIQEGFCGFARKNGVCMWPDEKPHQDLRMVHLYGFLGNMVYTGPEFNSLATWRYTHRGEREVILINFSEFWNILTPTQQQHQLTGDYNVTHYLQDLLRNASSEDAFMKTLMAMAAKEEKICHKVYVGPKTLLFVPSGMLVIERCINGGVNVGMRMSVKDQSAMAMQNLQGLLRIHEQYAPNATMTQIWKKATDVSDPSPDASGGGN